MVPSIEHNVSTICSEIQDMEFCTRLYDLQKYFYLGPRCWLGHFILLPQSDFEWLLALYLSLLISHCLSLLWCLFLFDQVLCLPVSRTCFVEGSSDSTLRSETVGALFTLPAMVGAAPGIVPVFRFHAIPRPGRSLLRKAAISAASPWFLF